MDKLYWLSCKPQELAIARKAISAEARYAHESYNYVFNPFLSTSRAQQANGGYPIVVLVQPIPRQSSTNYFTPKASIRFKPNDDLMLYAGDAKKLVALVSRDNRLMRLTLAMPVALTSWRLVLQDSAKVEQWLAGSLPTT